ncbi:MAG: D-alanyl-D-alanine carboxypeptidase family protein [Dermatophilaceae bacterium]
MTALRYAVSALALSLSLTAAAAFGIVGATSGAHAVGNVPNRNVPSRNVPPRSGPPLSDPTGGAQLAEPGVIVNLRPGVPAPPAMPGASFLVADMDTGQILAARAPHTPRLPASTLKTLTALTLIPRLDASTKIMVEPEDVRVEGSRVGILAGTAYDVPTLFQGLLLASGNDAANSLARANQSVAVTLNEMNATAAGLGAFDTVAKDPSGLDMPGQTSSAYDLALIGRAAMKLPDFRSYVSTKKASVPGGRSSDGKTLPGFDINNHNRLLYNYGGTIGIKNGYTIAAKQTFIAAATRAGKTYIVTEMDSPDGSWRPTAALLDWAFAHGTEVTPIGELVEPGSTTRPGLTAAAGNRAADGAPRAASGAEVLGRPTTVRLPALQPWVGASGLLAGMALVGALAARSISRRRG